MPYDLKKSLGGNIAEARKSSGLMQKDLARELDCVPAYISRLEAGDNAPSEDTLIVLCDLFKWDYAVALTVRNREKARCNDLIFDTYNRILKAIVTAQEGN